MKWDWDFIRGRRREFPKHLHVGLDPAVKMVSINNIAHPMQEPHLSDFEVAGQVRALSRTQLDHERVCTLARDRIVYLADRLGELEVHEKRPGEFLAWAHEIFGPVAGDRGERLLRFIEEAIELAHAGGIGRDVLFRIADRVYAGKPGEVRRELGQTQACLEMYARSKGLSSLDEAENEWERVRTLPAGHWRRRHAAKQDIGIAIVDPSEG
jgi:hypothetical protein